VTGGLTNGAFFDQSRLTYDFVNRTFGSDLNTLTNDVFRLEEGVAMFDENFDAIELYNGFNSEDTNGDGIQEDPRVDLTLRDSFNFFSLGKIVSLVGASDSHDTGTPVGAPG